MQYRITYPAEEDMVEVWRYTFRKWGEEQADLYIDTLLLRYIWLTDNPSLWKPRPEIAADMYSYTHKSHVIFFHVTNDVMDILRVLHVKMDFPRHFES